MRKSDMITYKVPVRRFGEYHQEETKGYCWYTEKDGETYAFMIRKNGKGYEVDEYGTGLKVGGNYSSINIAATNIAWMIKYHDLLGTVKRTHQIKRLRDGELLNPGDPVAAFRACCYKVPDLEEGEKG